MGISREDNRTEQEVELVACRRDNVTADAAGRIGIFPPELPELVRDAADSANKPNG
jgi:hypothetical protein